MKKNKIEFLTEIFVITIIIIGIAILSPGHSLKSNLEISINLIIWISLYFIQTKWLIPKYLKRRKTWNYIGFSVLTLILSILVLIPIELLYLEDLWYRRYYVAIPKLDYLFKFEWRYFEEPITGLLIAFFGTIFYGFIRYIKFPNRKIYTKTLPIGFSVIVIMLSSAFLIFVLIENNKKRPVPDLVTTTDNNHINVIEKIESISNLSDVLNQSITNKKLTCVTFWTSSCGAQFNQIEKINKLRKELKNDNIQFVYLCGDYKNDRDYWKDFIIRENIEGFHYYLDRQQFHKIFIDELNIKTGVVVVHTILVNSKHEILNKDFPLLKSKQELIKKINQI